MTIFIVPGRQGEGETNRQKVGDVWSPLFRSQKVRRSLLEPSQNERRVSIDHSLCFSPGLLELLEVLQDDVI